MAWMDSVSRQPEGFPGQRLVVVASDVVRQASRAPVTRDLAVTHLGHFVTAPGHFVRRPKGAGQWVMIYCLDGAGAAETRGERHELGRGDLIVLEPGEAHVYEADLFLPWSIFWVHFHGQRAADYLSALGWTQAAPVLHVPDTGTMLAAFEDVYRHTLHGHSEADMLALATSFARLLGLARLGARARDTRARRTEEQILAVLARLRDEPQRRWTVAAMARLANLSAAHFNVLFHRQTGSPPLNFLIRLRLQFACRLLAVEDDTVERIAHRVGYEDAYYFSRLFRRHLGVAPSRFRREVRAGR